MRQLDAGGIAVLLSLAALGCPAADEDENATDADNDAGTGTTPSATAGTDAETSAGPQTSGATQTSGEADPDLEEACRALLARRVACGLVDDVPETYCEMLPDYFAEYIGDSACAAATAEHNACLSGLDCQTLENDDFGCREAYEAGRESCPALFGFCQITGSAGNGGGMCSVEGSVCLDGNTYSVACAEDNGTTTCTCGTAGASFERPEAATACDGAGLAAEVTAECGWPEGVLPE